VSAPLFRLASALASHPDGDGRRRLREALEALGPAARGPEAAVLAAAARALAGGTGHALESAWIERFDRGVAANPLHETGYERARGFAVGERLAAVAGFYRAFGVEPVAGERLDHLAVELEFYAWLLAQQEFLDHAEDEEGSEIVTDGRRKFLAAHLGPLALAAAARPGVVEGPFAPAFAAIAELVAAECARLGVDAAPLELGLTGREESDEMNCAVAPERPPGGGRLRVVDSL
jgi:nitrate reductase assembly molybdenum cofactor insertion protein NarJ